MNDVVAPIKRIIGEIQGHQPGPTVVFFAGIHGNEPSGIKALENVLSQLDGKGDDITGKIIAIAGNLKALECKERFVSKDLNRLWTSDRMASLNHKDYEDDIEETSEQKELSTLLQDIIDSNFGPFYFLDLHSTSGKTIPFLTVNDSLLNRKFTTQYPVPIVLGIEEYLEGPLLSYINEHGFVSFGFEGGQHDEPESVENHELFIYTTLALTESVKPGMVEFDEKYELLKKRSREVKGVFEIFYRHELKESDNFIMKEGFENFERIKKGQFLAKHNGEELKADRNGRIFMPRYQPLGNDGFFGIKRTPRFFLWLSAVLRKLRMDFILVLLPGIRILEDDGRVMMVNTRVARFYSKQIFHLFGYRSRRLDKFRYLMRNREWNSRNSDYRKSNWY